jgi:hypothetical protein
MSLSHQTTFGIIDLIRHLQTSTKIAFKGPADHSQIIIARGDNVLKLYPDVIN